MDYIKLLFGEGKELDALQMSLRAISVFIISFVLIRISGRRSFSMHGSFDNVVGILLGAILSRAVLGVSPFWPTIAAALVICILHRILGRLSVANPKIRRVIEGDKLLIYNEGKKNLPNMKRGLVSEEDIMQGLRKELQQESLEGIKKIYVEASGLITVVK